MSDGDRNKTPLRRFYEELWNGEDLKANPELVAHDFVDRHPPLGASLGREGLAALGNTWRRAFPGMRETCEDLIAGEDKVVGRFTLRGTHKGRFVGVPPTGRRLTMSRIDIVRVAGGRIAEFWYSEHLPELMQQLGAAPNFATNYKAQDE